MHIREETAFYKSGQEAGEEFMKTPHGNSYHGGKRFLYDRNRVDTTKYYAHVIMARRLKDRFSGMFFDGKYPKRELYYKTNAHHIRRHLNEYEITSNKLSAVLHKIEDESPKKIIEPLTDEYDVKDWVKKGAKLFHTGFMDKLWEPYT